MKKEEVKILNNIEVLTKIIEEDKPCFSLKSGFPTLDRHIGDFREGELITITGVTKHGKTEFCRTLTKNFIDQNEHPLWLSYEEPPKEFLEKFENRGTSLLFYMPSFLEIYNPEWCEQVILKAKEEVGIKVVFIDHLHYLINVAAFRNPSLVIGSAIRRLKRLAIDHNLIIFLLCHIQKTRIESENDIDFSLIRDCIEENQLVYCNGKNKPIKDVRVGEKIIKLKNDGILNAGKVKNIGSAGIKDVYQVTTKTGKKIICTENHKFYTKKLKSINKPSTRRDRGINVWLPLKEIDINYLIATVKKYPEICSNNNTLNTDAGELLGWLLADGHTNKRFHSEIATETLDEARHIQKIAQSGFNIYCNIGNGKRRTKRVYLSNNGKNNKLRCFLKNIKFNPTGNKKYIPPIIFEQSNDVIGSFLRGYFSGDGSFNRSGYKSAQFTISSISEKVIMGAQHLLLRLGIISHVNSHYHKCGYRKNKILIYTLTIGDHNLLKLKDEIGLLFQNGEKIKNYIYKNYNFKSKKNKNDIYFDKIKSIKYIGKLNTYDIEIEKDEKETGSFCVNDILVSNSSFICQESSAVIFIYRKVKSDGVIQVDQSLLKLCFHRRTGAFEMLIPIEKRGYHFRELEILD